jgi:hypothetical protein
VIHDIDCQLKATRSDAAMTFEQAVERYVRDRMADGELLTWRYDRQTRHAILFMPDDVEVISCRHASRVCPRSDSFGGRCGEERRWPQS